MLNDKSTHPRFYEVNGHTIYGVPSPDVIIDELGAPPFVPAPPVVVRFTRPWGQR